MTIRVRFGELSDTTACVNMYQAAMIDSDWGKRQPPTDMAALYHMTIDIIDQSRMFVAVKGEEIVGAIALVVRPYGANPNYHFLEEFSLYVYPAYRSEKTGRDRLIVNELISAAKNLADHHQMPLLMSINAGGERVEAKERLFQRGAGMRYVGGMFEYHPEAHSATRVA